MELIPLKIKEANAFVKTWHRHNKKVVGMRFCIGALDENKLVGVAIVGRPNARMIEHVFTAEVLRVCVLPNAPKNCNSFLYAACWRAWRSMGGKKLITYTLKSESGESLRGAGWRIIGETKPRKNPWCGPDRVRQQQDIFSEIKLKWEQAAGDSASSR